MSRLEETESVINCTDWCNGWEGEARSMHHIARTLAAEVDARDEVITKLLAMLKPEPEHPKWGYGICESCGWHGCFSSFVGRAGGELEDNDEALCPLCGDAVQDVDRSIYVNLHARAVAIAEGREG